MARSPERFLRQLLAEVLRRAAGKARPLIPSVTLRRAMTEQVIDELTAQLMIPHYWAIYIHDGRGSIEKRSGFLVWFRDQGDDPRTFGGVQQPVRASEIRRLTKQQFRDGMRANRAHLASGGDPFDVPMIVVKRVRGVRPVPFFSRGMVGFVDIAGPLIAKRFDQWIQETIDTDRLSDKRTARISL